MTSQELRPLVPLVQHAVAGIDALTDPAGVFSRVRRAARSGGLRRSLSSGRALADPDGSNPPYPLSRL